MPQLHRARVVAIGNESDMLRLNRALLSNMNSLPRQEEGPAPSLGQLYELVQQTARREGDPYSGFLYPMVNPAPYGSADAPTCRYTMRREDCGLYTACFAYESEKPFQPEDWLQLHQQCNCIPVLALRASWDFALDKGMMIFTGGRVREDWNRMAECWLWLIHQYEFGYPPEEAVERLKKLEPTLNREDCDLSVAQLLQCCADNLRCLAGTEDITHESLADAQEKKDIPRLFAMIRRLGETVLWETERNARWLACLEAVQKAWAEA